MKIPSSGPTVPIRSLMSPKSICFISENVAELCPLAGNLVPAMVPPQDRQGDCAGCIHPSGVMVAIYLYFAGADYLMDLSQHGLPLSQYSVSFGVQPASDTL